MPNRPCSRLSRTLLPLALLTLAPACYTEGELGNLGFYLNYTAEVGGEVASGDRYLQGSRPCPQISFRKIELEDGSIGSELVFDSEAYRACFDESLSGPASFDAEGCLMFEEPGEVVWELSPGSCAESGDRLRFGVVEAGDSTQLGFHRWRTQLIHEIALDPPDEENELRGFDPGRSLDELLVPPSQPRQVFAGQVDAAMLRLDDDQGRVFFTLPEVQLELIGDAERVEPVESEDWELDEYQLWGEVPLRMVSGATARVRATLPDGQQRESPELVGVSLDAAASLDLMTIGGHLYADVRDAEGRVIHAAPIDWSLVEGSVAIEAGGLNNDMRTPEYANVDTRCAPPPEPGEPPEIRRAVIRARLGPLEDTVEYEWEVEPRADEGFSSPWEPNPDCMEPEPEDDPDEGCGCTSAAGSEPRAPLGSSLVLLALVAVRRRSRRVRDDRR